MAELEAAPLGAHLAVLDLEAAPWLLLGLLSSWALKSAARLHSTLHSTRIFYTIQLYTLLYTILHYSLDCTTIFVLLLYSSLL